MRDIELTLEIGATEISLLFEYTFIRGTYSSGGEPADPDEIDIHTIKWVKGAMVEGYQLVVDQVLFEILASDEWVYSQICEAEYANH